MEIIVEQGILMTAHSAPSSSSWIRARLLAGCQPHTWKGAGSAIVGNSQWKLRKSTWNELFPEAPNNNIIWVGDFVLFLVKGLVVVVGGHPWQEWVALKDQYKQVMGQSPTRQAHLIRRFRIRATLTPNIESGNTPHPLQHRRSYKRQLCHPSFNDGMMEAVDQKLQRGRLLKLLPCSVEHIRNTPQRTT